MRRLVQVEEVGAGEGGGGDHAYEVHVGPKHVGEEEGYLGEGERGKGESEGAGRWRDERGGCGRRREREKREGGKGKRGRGGGGERERWGERDGKKVRMMKTRLTITSDVLKSMLKLRGARFTALQAGWASVGVLSQSVGSVEPGCSACSVRLSVHLEDEIDAKGPAASELCSCIRRSYMYCAPLHIPCMHSPDWVHHLSISTCTSGLQAMLQAYEPHTARPRRLSA